MFIVSLFGGLGSQIEQYAFSLALQKAYPDVRIFYDINNIQYPDHNGFELENVFSVDIPRAELKDICVLSDRYPYTGKKFRVFSKLYNIRRQVFGIKGSWIMPDDSTAYYKEVFELNPLKSYMFFGNWANPRYFADIIDEIQERLVFKPIEDSRNKEMAETISSCTSVSIHVRRGDYVSCGYPLLDKDYYEKAIDIMREKVDNPHFFIFSDDVECAKQIFDFMDSYTIIDYNKNTDSFRDMQLMSMCKHNIIANSTFSRWAAYLNQNKEKVVIGPKYHHYVCKHTLCDDNWIIIDNLKK